MAAGFQAWDGQGRLTTDMTDRFSRFITSGSVSLGFNQTANIAVSGLDSSDQWHVTASQGAYVFYGANQFSLRASQSFGFGVIYYSVWRR